MSEQPETFYPETRKHWRKWLQKHHESANSVWVVFYKKSSGQPVVTWSEAVDEALCFGWIDSTRRPLDDKRFIQFFTKRKPTSVWSKINKEKVARLLSEGLMMPAGLASIKTAKQNGSWTKLDKVENLSIPRDLAAAFKSVPGSKKYFDGLSKSVKKIMLQWIVTAKRAETRQKRISELAELAGNKQKPKQF